MGTVPINLLFMMLGVIVWIFSSLYSFIMSGFYQLVLLKVYRMEHIEGQSG